MDDDIVKLMFRKWKLYHNGLWKPKKLEDIEFMNFVKNTFIDLNVLYTPELPYDVFYFKKDNCEIFSMILSNIIIHKTTININKNVLISWNNSLFVSYLKKNNLFNGGFLKKFIINMILFHYNLKYTL